MTTPAKPYRTHKLKDVQYHLGARWPQHLAAAYNNGGGSIEGAALALGVEPSTISYQMQKCGLRIVHAALLPGQRIEIVSTKEQP